MMNAQATRRLELSNLYQIEKWQDTIPWKPFHEGVEIHCLYDNGGEGSSASLIRFKKGAKVPLHLHQGYEHVFVLFGEQTDQTSCAPAGTLMINAPGSKHQITSETGCIALVIYEKPVRFIPLADEV